MFTQHEVNVALKEMGREERRTAEMLADKLVGALEMYAGIDNDEVQRRMAIVISVRLESEYDK